MFWGMDREDRQREKEKERRRLSSLKESETICCIENIFAAGEKYIC